MLAVLIPTAALASPGKVKKAAKLQAKYEAGDKASLVEALGVLEAAIEHPKVESDPVAWGLMGHLRLEAAKEAADPDGFADAAKDLAKALGLGAEGEVRDRAITDLKAVLGTLFNAATDALEAERNDEAARRMVTVLAVRQSLADADVEVRALEDRILTLAIRVSILQGELDDALAFHQALLERGVLEPAIAAHLARSLGEADRMSDALALLATLASEDGGEPRLLRAHVELLMASGDNEGAVARIEGQRENLWRSVSGALLLAELYEMADDEEKTLEAYARILEQEPKHVDGRLRIAAHKAGMADEAQARLDAGDMSWREKKALTSEIAAMRTDVVATLEATFGDEPRRIDIGERLVAAQRAAGDEEAALAVQEKVDALKAETP
jgi:lipopolysaccharide biosynthesis regulator YciM